MKREKTFWRKTYLLFLFIFGLLFSMILTPNLTFAEGGILSDLSVNEGKLFPSFDSGVNEYMLDVANSVTTLDVTALLAGPAKQQLLMQGEPHGNGLPWEFALNVGENNLSVEVYDPETHVSNAYTLTINRAANDPTNADLWKIKSSVGVITPIFDLESPDTEYTLQVENIIKTLEITATPANGSASMTINEGIKDTGTQIVKVNLEPGENIIPITVTSGDESVTKTYNLKIFRGPSSNADLKELTVSTGLEPSDLLTLEPTFDSRIVTYSVTAPNINNINLVATLDDPGATLMINGETAQSGIMKKITLDQGSNLIPIVVTAPDKATEKAYIVSINGFVSNADLASLSINAIDTNNPEGPEVIDLGFEATKTNYQFAVNNTVERLIINTSTADPKALVMLNGTIIPSGDNRELDLTVGENTLQLIVIAQDASTKIYTLEVFCRVALTIETKKLPLGLLGFPYKTIFTAQGGEKPYTWDSINLPAGLSLDSATGEISGSPETTGTYEINLTVTDAQGNNATKKLSLQINLSDGNGGYLLTALDSSAYTIGRASNGFPTMTVKNKVSGMIPFSIKITPVHEHQGQETVVFVQLRKDAQRGINAVKADFDIASFAQTTFDVQAGDLIKVYMVDDLKSDPLVNPNVL